MARTQTMVQLSDDLIAALDEAAGREGVSRSALIRSLLSDGLRGRREATLGEQIAGGYRRLPQSTPEEWGAPAEAADATTRDLLLRLDAEDREAGHGAW